MSKDHPILQSSHILLDGALGTELYKRGVYINRCFEEISLSNESLVKQIHKDYVDAGANLITTNTWGANRLKLQGHSLESRFEEINRKGVEIAKEAAGDKALVVGSLGPLGVRIEPFGPTSFEETREYFREQAKVLKEAGADCLALETFGDLSELQEAIAACQEVAPELYLFAYLSLESETETLQGTPLEWAIRKLESLEVDVIGLNCSIGPKVMYDALKNIAPLVSKPISLKPNAGSRNFVDGRYLNLCSPEYMAEFTKDYFRVGAKFVGGCCGTGPEHIKVMSNALRFNKACGQDFKQLLEPSDAIKLAETRVGSTKASPFPLLKPDSLWAKKIEAGEPVVSVELLPPESTDPTVLLKKTKRLKDLGVDVVNIPDGPRASPRMSALLTSVLIERESKVETILHYTCRDRNMIGIQSDMIGAQAIGLKNMLLITGDPPKSGLYPHVTGVFDVDAIGLTNIVNNLNCGIDIGGKQLKKPTNFSVGVGVNPGADDLEKELRRFMWKVKAGAQWAISQPVFDVEVFKDFIKRIEEMNLRIPIIAGVWPLVSHKNALFLHNEIPGISIPDDIMSRMKETLGQEKPSETGVAIAKEMMEELVDTVEGFQISAPFGNIDLIIPLLELAKRESKLFSRKSEAQTSSHTT